MAFVSSPMQSSAKASRTMTVLPWMGLALVALIGLVHVPFPFSGDQALFALSAREMANGEVLYRDFWDMKQPATFIYYYLGSLLFGNSEVGIRGFEWLYMVGFAYLLVRSLKHRFQHAVPLALLPVLTVGLYYSASPSLLLTQAEAIVGVPIFGLIWCFQKALETRRKWPWLLAAGILGSIVLCFKLIFLLFLFPIFAFSLFKIARTYPDQKQFQAGKNSLSVATLTSLGLTMVKLAVPLLSGLLLPWLLMLGYFYSQDSLEIVYKTFLVYPPMVVSGDGPDKDWLRFVKSLGYFVVAFASTVLLGSLQGYRAVRRADDLLTLNLVLWALGGLSVIWLQSQGWWPYYYLLLFIPFGTLAALFLNSRWDVLTRLWSAPDEKASLKLRRGVLVAGSCLLLLVPAMGLGVKSLWLMKSGLALEPEQRLQYQMLIQDDYKVALDEIAIISKPDSQPGDIFVMGNPLIYYLSGRNQAGPINGWSLEWLMPFQWQELHQQLRTYKPVYIFVDYTYQWLLAEKGADIMRMMEQDYVQLHQSDVGTWYELAS